MRIAVFGGTGKTGHLLVAQALDEGHTVVAYARDPARLPITHERLQIVRGELTDAAAIGRTVAGADAVISLLGQGAPADGTPIARGTRNILAAMMIHGVRRIVAVTAASVTTTRDAPRPLTRLLVALERRFLRPAYDDTIATARAITESGLAWTIVRPPLLSDGPRTGRIEVGRLGDGITGTRLSRANAADFLLDLVDSDALVGQAPVVTDARQAGAAPAAAQQIAPGVYCVPTGRGAAAASNVFFVASGPSWVLIDAGWPGQARQIRRAAHDVFGPDAGPVAIYLTHAHPDHTGAADELAREWGVPVLVHPAELPTATRGYLPEYANPLDRWVLGPLIRLLPAGAGATRISALVEAFHPDAALPGLSDWRAVPTPGHTPGHTAFFRPADRVLISGDAVLTVDVNAFGGFVLPRRRISGPPRIATWDWPLAIRSVARLAELEPRVLGPGHGKPMAGIAVAAELRRFSATASLASREPEPALG